MLSSGAISTEPLDMKDSGPGRQWQAIPYIFPGRASAGYVPGRRRPAVPWWRIPAVADSDVLHQTVLRDEAVAALVTDPGGHYVDGTFGYRL